MAQSSLMADSMVEYLTMNRGGNLVAHTIIRDFSTSIFRGFTRAGHYELLEQVYVEQPRSYELPDAFKVSVLQLEPLCTSPTEVRYLQSLISCIDALRTSPYEGMYWLHESLDNGMDRTLSAKKFKAWRNFVPLYVLPATFTNEEFVSFISADNYAGHILVIHMFLLEYLLGPFCIGPSEEPKCQGRKFVIISWTKNLAKRLPPDYQKHVQWPLEYCKILANEKKSSYLLSP